jgi:hypothetical protein
MVKQSGTAAQTRRLKMKHWKERAAGTDGGAHYPQYGALVRGKAFQQLLINPYNPARAL